MTNEVFHDDLHENLSFVLNRTQTSNTPKVRQMNEYKTTKVSATTASRGKACVVVSMIERRLYNVVHRRSIRLAMIDLTRERIEERWYKREPRIYLTIRGRG